MDSLSITKKLVSLGVLVLIVAASATQTEVAKYVSSERGYSKPYFTFYLTHSMFAVIAPLHLLVLRILRPHTTRQYSDGMRLVLAEQLSLPIDSTWRLIITSLSRKMLLLTTLISLPSLCWYVAVPLTGVSEITTLYASSTFWTYGFALWLLREPLSKLIISAITIAFIGVLLITYSGVEEDEAQARSIARSPPKLPERSSPHRILGDLVMLAGSIFLGYYEVVYKQMLPESHGGVVTTKTMDESSSADPPPPLGRGSYRRISSNAGDDVPIPLRIHRPSSSSSSVRRKPVEEGNLPIALHANLLTSIIGWMTLLIFWLPIPLLNWLGLEAFVWPSGIWPWMLVICLAGATYNAGFMVLIGILGPVTASLANLLTIAVIAVIETVFGQAMHLWTMVGASLVALGFGLIVWQGETPSSVEDADVVVDEET